MKNSKKLLPRFHVTFRSTEVLYSKDVLGMFLGRRIVFGIFLLEGLRCM